jgi:hypothetical protein
LCDGDCTCNNKFASKRIISDVESITSAQSSTVEFEVQKINYDTDRFWVQDEVIEYEESCSSDSVYEEPDSQSEASEEDIMAEIVREKLLNGWTSEEEDEEFSEVESFQYEKPSIGAKLSKAPLNEKEVLIPTESIEMKKDNDEVESENVLKSIKIEPLPTSKQPKVSEPAKKKKASLGSLFTPSGNSSKLNGCSNPNASTNPWFALAAMNMNTSFLNSYQKPKQSSDSNQNSINAAAAFASNLLKKPVNMNSVATAAAALMASPAAMRAFSDIRKRELDKMMESINLHSRNRSNLSVSSSISITGEPLNSPASVSKNNDEIGKLLKQPSLDKSEEFLLEDILDNGQFEDTVQSPKSEDEYSKFKKIPIGTYWNSQRKKKKPKNIQKALKRSTTNKLLESTLLETLPMKKRKKGMELILSPMLGPYESKNPSAFFLN